MMHQAYDSVREFEACVADFAGSRYAVAVDSGTNALFLCCKYLKVGRVRLPSRTYFSVPGAVLHAGGEVEFADFPWRGTYRLEPYPVVDGAARFRRRMYEPGTYHCLSFNYLKHLKVGKGGMVLTDDPAAVRWLKLARYSGRHEFPCSFEGCTCTRDTVEMVGWNMYMTPEQASRGLALMAHQPDFADDLDLYYPDLSAYDIYQRDHYEVAHRPPA